MEIKRSSIFVKTIMRFNNVLNGSINNLTFELLDLKILNVMNKSLMIKLCFEKDIASEGCSLTNILETNYLNHALAC